MTAQGSMHGFVNYAHDLGLAASVIRASRNDTGKEVRSLGARAWLSEQSMPLRRIRSGVDVVYNFDVVIGEDRDDGDDGISGRERIGHGGRH